MAIVFDQVDGVVQREPEAPAPEDPTVPQQPSDPDKTLKELMRAERRRERLMAD